MDSAPRWVSRIVAEAMHLDVLRAHGGMPGVRDEGALGSALARGRQRLAYVPDSDLAALAASCGYGIARNHPFNDGNKRSAFMVMAVFLALNGLDLEAPEAEVVTVVLDLAGLAASGHSLELVIETSGDGKGVRLRFGSPSSPGAPVTDVEAAPSPLDAVEEPHTDEPEGHVEELEPHGEREHETEYAFEAETDAEAELPGAEHEIVAETVAEPVFEDFDVPFLTGGLPSPADAAIVTPQADEPVAAEAHEPAAVDMHGLWVEDAAVDEAVDQPEPLVRATIAPAIPDEELTEDPAKILAEIRARLAALDGRS